MRTRFAVWKKWICFIFCMVMLMGSSAQAAHTRVADPSTLDGWKEDMPITGNLSTENTGDVWTGKTVLAGAMEGITPEEDQFLVALSAIGSNSVVKGMSNLPTDTMLVLDVSGSMKGDADDLVKAANETIHALLGLNEYNRIGVVAYSNSSLLMLPLNRYTTTNATYLNHSISNGTETISTNGNVRIAGAGKAPDYRSRTVVGATYIQKAVHMAMQQFTASSNATTVQDPTLGTLQRKPIMVLMSDGAPTNGTTSFANPGDKNMGNGNDTSTALGFVTQLTAAYAKKQMEAKYGTTSLFYTLGLGVGKDNVAKSVLDPKNSTSDINSLWTQYQALNTGRTLQVQSDRNVTKIAEKLNQHYVDSYFAASDGAGMISMFQKIVSAIDLQSRYYPTLVEESEDLSGYVSFVDKIGEYMEVKRIHGIMIGDELHTGELLSENFITGGGNLGTYDQPTALGDEFVWSVQTRLGISAEEARSLLGNAYRHGQISYGGKGVFSNYVGWYADQQGRYLGFWADGTTTPPDGAVYEMRSYGYLGDPDPDHGVTTSDMMYTTVRVRRTIATGEEMVSFAVPAALLPLITYEIELDASRDLIRLSTSGATEPIRLVYEVGLREGINEYTLTQLVDEEYRAANTDPETGEVYFYTNQYEKNGSMGYQKVNSYSYFRPSRQNERYYYQQDVPILKSNGDPYTGSAAPSGTGYLRKHTIYVYENGEYRTHTGTHELPPAVLAYAKQNGEDWYIPAGTVHLNTHDYDQEKTDNPTETLAYANAPYVDTGSAQGGRSYVIGATLGNNGRISLRPSAGIRIRKTVTPGSAANAQDSFTMVIESSVPSETANLSALLVAADGTETHKTVSFANGRATVQLNHGDTLYISGMDTANTYTVSETETAEHRLVSINGDATLASITLRPALNSPEAHFINTPKGTGSLTISKVVEHPLGADYDVTKEFAIDVQLTGPGTAGKSFTATGKENSVATDANGKFTVHLTHNEQITLTGLPEGTVAVVTEPSPGAGFTASYYVNTRPTAGTSGTVTIAANGVSSVTVNNKYQPTSASANVKAFVKKTFEGGWKNGYKFDFELQEYDIQAGKWKTPVLGAVTADQENQPFEFQNAFAYISYSAPGEYYYRFVEKRDKPIDGVIYDLTVHGFTVVVGDADMDGQLEITNVHDDRTTVECQEVNGIWNVTATFLNREVPVADVTIEITKSVDNQSGSPLGTPSGFRFAVYDNEACAGTPIAVSEPTTDRGFTRFIREYEAKDADIYKRWLREERPDTTAAGWTYDQRIIPITIEVKVKGDADTQAVEASIWQGHGEKPANAGTSLQLSFTNEYDPADAVLEMDFVSKVLENKALEAGMFSFALYEESDMNVPVQTASNSADGKVAFENLTFDQVGTYYYKVMETSVDGNGYVADKTTYRVEVTVTDQNGTLEASYKVLNIAADTITFRNVYDPVDTTYTIRGQKTLNGRTLLNSEFYFVLTETDANGNAVAGGHTARAGNLLDGSFAFEPITYTMPGVYYYTVHEEDAENKQGIQYDLVKRLVKVTVTDDGRGVLSASSEVMIGNEAQSGLHFINRYVPSPVDAAITGTKRLRGRELQAEQFSFELYAADENGMPQGQPLQTVKNAADGAFAFAPYTYDAAGTYHYCIKEVGGGQIIDEITYDSVRYHVTVEVTDNRRGTLSAAVVAHDEMGIPQMGAEFINTYGTVGGDTVRIEGAKMLTGREQHDGEFTFELYQTGADYLVAEGQQPWLTVQNTRGQFAFELAYDQEHVNQTFYYVLREKNAGQTIDGIQYSDQSYQIMVMVENGRSGDGVLETVTVIHSDGQLSQNVLFINHYLPSGRQPATGDGSRPVLWLMLLAGSAAVMIAQCRRRRLHE